MRLIIKNDYEAMSAWATNHVINAINSYQPTDSRPFVLGLPTGSTPLGMYKRLIQACKKGKVSFKHVVTFNMDEYVNLDEQHPESYHAFMWNNFFSYIDIQPQNINILNGNTDDIETECNRYEQKIKTIGGIHLFIGGVGTDGHIAFNEPGSSPLSTTRMVVLTKDTITANARFFNNDTRKVPTRALTVGIKTILDAKEVMILVNGHNKARALKHGIEDPVSHKWAISFLQMHPNGIIACDEDACDELSVGTYKYHKEIEK